MRSGSPSAGILPRPPQTSRTLPDVVTTRELAEGSSKSASLSSWNGGIAQWDARAGVRAAGVSWSVWRDKSDCRLPFIRIDCEDSATAKRDVVSDVRDPRW